MSAFGGKADMAYCTAKCPLMTQSGHSYRANERPLSGAKATLAMCQHSPHSGDRQSARI